MKLASCTLYITSLLWLNLTHAKIGYFWHITDLHYDPFHNSPEFKGCRHGHNHKEHSHRNGRHRLETCDASWSLIQSAAAFMAERHPDTLEFVLWTGDILSSSMEHASEELKLEAVRNVTDVLSRTFSSQFVFPALGHNDPPPSRRLVDMWMQWLPTEALDTFETGGYYTIEQSHSKLRIVVLNSNLWAGGASRSDAHAHSHARAQWKWLEGVLDKTRKQHEMVYLVAHAGPGMEERPNAGSASAAGGGELSPLANSRILHTIRQYSDVIAGQFYGHRHADTFRIIYNEGRPVSWAFLAPSLTPRGAGSVSNPGLRLYKFDSNTGKVLDYTQYYLDISHTRGETHWSIEYNLTQYYGLREVTAASLDALADRIRNHHDRGVFAKYLAALRARHATDTDCDSACVHVHFCAITRADYHDFRACVSNPASALASRAPHPHSAAILLYAILVLIST
ncbi:hypothetical protein JYU34_006641 [Plutella xylostella]|uniref:Sphingomyelin phosphodiesterase C-terminal domain-containing protein n=1 Tax=Plutella xylostella TaxID=51655 RepID=A0ABQ7QSK0_PLUXY|nr:acid sphingomyelinase-like phosphodiesterase 3a [Plutella xylostella]KAG7308007.1 hypothetical protein JYU34_006641 [Plutella xylostella]